MNPISQNKDFNKQLELMASEFEAKPNEKKLDEISTFITNHSDLLKIPSLEKMGEVVSKVELIKGQNSDGAISQLFYLQDKIETLIKAKGSLTSTKKTRPPLKDLQLDFPKSQPIFIDKKIVEKNLHHLKVLANNGNADALYFLAETHFANFETKDAMDYLELAAANGHEKANLMLATYDLELWKKETNKITLQLAGKLIFSKIRNQLPVFEVQSEEGNYKLSITDQENKPNLFAFYAMAECYRHGVGSQSDLDKAECILKYIRENSTKNDLLYDQAEDLMEEILHVRSKKM